MQPEDESVVTASRGPDLHQFCCALVTLPRGVAIAPNNTGLIPHTDPIELGQLKYAISLRTQHPGADRRNLYHDRHPGMHHSSLNHLIGPLEHQGRDRTIYRASSLAAQYVANAGEWR